MSPKIHEFPQKIPDVKIRSVVKIRSAVKKIRTNITEMGPLAVINGVITLQMAENNWVTVVITLFIRGYNL